MHQAQADAAWLRPPLRSRFGMKKESGMTTAIGFIGLGVMGEPMCRNLAKKSGVPVYGFDRADAPLERLAEAGVKRATTLAELAKTCDVIFMALPSGKHVAAVCEGDDGLLAHADARHTIVDLGTSPVEASRELASASAAIFAKLQPLIATFATDITHCGDVGAGQVVKILNNMVLMETVVALSEALETAKRAGLDPKVVFETLAKGSADSFALRNHGMKAMLPGNFPERAFSTEYARKDISYALDLARSVNIQLQGAELADKMLGQAIDAGDGDLYWPVIARVLETSRT
ncbi:MAG: NAD(P)-dependent oxidoreductase [Hyphomicrobiales bacterium]|nr:NAD(P)-dependent oxidoreductase [Hyphomicrobiales bacterium]